MNILKQYGGWDINGKNKKSFVKKNHCLIYAGEFDSQFLSFGIDYANRRHDPR